MMMLCVLYNISHVLASIVETGYDHNDNINVK